MSALRKPHNTEKMTLMADRPGNKQYAFRVDPDASKVDIRSEIERLYEVKVSSIRTMVVRGKKRSRQSKSGFIQGASSTFKKAIVTLSEGQAIDFYKNI
jgi:large subunit ribosomal protein L23